MDYYHIWRSCDALPNYDFSWLNELFKDLANPGGPSEKAIADWVRYANSQGFIEPFLIQNASPELPSLINKCYFDPMLDKVVSIADITLEANRFLQVAKDVSDSGFDLFDKDVVLYPQGMVQLSGEDYIVRKFDLLDCRIGYVDVADVSGKQVTRLPIGAVEMWWRRSKVVYVPTPNGGYREGSVQAENKDNYLVGFIDEFSGDCRSKFELVEKSPLNMESIRDTRSISPKGMLKYWNEHVNPKLK
jgi:hypothetical protein